MRRLTPGLAILLFLSISGSAEPEQVHRPVYSDDLRRQTVLVTFAFVDAADNPVDELWAGRRLQASVRRVSDDFEWTEPGFVDRNFAVAGTPQKPGLEPGTYRLHADFGAYGRTSHDFEVGGQPLALTIQLPNERRVVRVKYVDQEGNPLTWVARGPHFSAALESFQLPDARFPEHVLRLPPRATRGLGSFGQGRRSGRGGPGLRLITDEGVMYVHVFTGVDGRLNIPLGEELYGVESRELSAPFDDEVIVEVAPTDAYAALEAERAVGNESDPGHKLHYTVPPKPQPAPQPEFTQKAEIVASPTVLAWTRNAVAVGPEGSVPALLEEGVWHWSDLDEMVPAVFGTHEPPVRAQRAYLAASRRDQLAGEIIFGSRRYFPGLYAEEGEFRGTFLRVLDADGRRVAFAEAVVMPLAEDELATAMRGHEIKLRDQGQRPSANAGDNRMRTGINEDASELLLRRAIGDAAWDALEKREYRVRFAMFSAWYDSFKRMDGEADGYVIAPHIRLEEGKRYVLYLWGDSRDDLAPDHRLVIKGQGPITDLGVIRLPRKPQTDSD